VVGLLSSSRKHFGTYHKAGQCCFFPYPLKYIIRNFIPFEDDINNAPNKYTNNYSNPYNRNMVEMKK
jgi:hypothetical protein